MDKFVAGFFIIAETIEVGGISRIGQGIEIEDIPVFFMCQYIFDKVCADEAGTAGDEDVFRHGSIACC